MHFLRFIQIVFICVRFLSCYFFRSILIMRNEVELGARASVPAVRSDLTCAHTDFMCFFCIQIVLYYTHRDAEQSDREI